MLTTGACIFMPLISDVVANWRCGLAKLNTPSVLGSLTVSQSIKKLVSASAAGAAVPGFV